VTRNFQSGLLVGVLFTLADGGTVSAAPPANGELRMYGVLNAKDDHPDVLGWLPRQNWLWGVEVLPSATTESVRSLRSRGLHIVVELLAHPATRARHAAHKRTAVPDAATQLSRLIDASGGDLIWEPLLEDDSAGVAFPQQFLRARPRTHAEAKRLLDGYLDEALRPDPPLPAVHRWGVCGYATSAHAFAAHGLDCVLVERTNDDVEDLQTAIAFARGAARQYGTAWGIDLSLWWGPIYGCVQHLPASLYKRHLYLSYFSGARTFRIEGADLLARETGGRDTPVGLELAAFHRTIKDLEPGTPDVPVAILLPEDHGWMTPPYWRTTNEAWNYARIPYRPGDRGIDGFFGTAFPGCVYAMDPFPFGAYRSETPPASPFSLACVTPEFAPTPDDQYAAPPPLPFGAFTNRDQARKQLIAQGTDPSPYRPMADSRWGDVFDVLTESAQDAILARYNVVVLLGPLRLNDSLTARARRYVEHGGRLIVAAGVVGPSDSALTGLSIQPEQRVGRAWRWADGDWIHEAYRYLPCSSADSDPATTILARAQSGEPLVASHRLGQGTVYTCLLPWYEAGHASLAGAARHLFDVVFDQVRPVDVTGPPCEWLSTRGQPDRYVVIANHDGSPWHGTIRLRSNGTERPPTVIEALTGRSLAMSTTSSGALEVIMDIPPYDLRVLQFRAVGIDAGTRKNETHTPAGSAPY
jgi:hypothetical protein